MPSFKAQMAELRAQSREELRAWLAENQDSSPGVWLVLNKKESGKPYMPYTEVVDDLLCYGWIDSVPNKIDATCYKLMITPRKAGSVWSAVNKKKLERLAAEGRLQARALQLIEAVKADGSWASIDSAEAYEVPDDLQTALAANPQAQENWNRFAPSSRKAILQYILLAKRPETRQKRVEETVSLAAQGKRANHPADKLK